jgi:hypothetical protein
MNCTQLDDAAHSLEAQFDESPYLFAVAFSALLAVSLLLLAVGKHILRPVATVAGGTGALVLVYAASRDSDFGCEVRLGAAVSAGFAVGLVVCCLVPRSIALVGAAGLATAGHFVYDALPLDRVEPPFHVAGVSGVYVLSIGGAALLGALATCWYRKFAMRVASALIGGGGIAASVALAMERAGSRPPPLLLLGIGVVSASGGVAVQTYRSNARRRNRSAREGPSVQA